MKTELKIVIGVMFSLLLMNSPVNADQSSVTGGFFADWFGNINMSGHNLSNLGTPLCSGYAYCIYDQSGTIIAINGTTQNVDYSGTGNVTINQAITAVSNSPSKGKILFYPGLYYNVSLILTEGVLLECTNPEKIILNYGCKLFGDGINPVITMNWINITSNQNMTRGTGFSNFILDGKGANNVTYLPNADTLLIQNNRFNGTGWAIYIDYIGTLPPTGTLLPGTGTPGIVGNTIQTYKGIYCKYCTQSWIEKNWFENTQSSQWITLISPIKVRVNSNEFNTLNSGCAINLSDDSFEKLDMVMFLGNQFIVGAGKKLYCLNLGNNAASDHLTIDDISFTTGGWDYPNLPNSYINILGYSTRRTSNISFASIPAGDTSVNVTHGIYAVSQNNIKVILTPLNDPKTNYWVSNRGQTYFRINLAAPRNYDVGFMWIAEYDNSSTFLNVVDSPTNGVSFGNSASCPGTTAFGEGDTCYDTTNNSGYTYTTTWQPDILTEWTEMFNGTGGATVFAVTHPTILVNSTQVSMNGSKQYYGAGYQYTANTTHIIFNSAPVLNANIEVIYVQN